MNQKEKFQALVSKEKTDTLERARERIKNREMLRESRAIALKVLVRLDELGWKQRKLAEALDVSPQQVSKIVSGKENLTLSTLVKLQKVLDIPLLATYHEKRERKPTVKVTWRNDKTVRMTGTGIVHLQNLDNYPMKKVVEKTMHTSDMGFLEMECE
ncbi:MAG: helix-turn-helix transcriptional regulator [bacterium]|nr:helix-turn-helix transcriptional regulator [bacterium]